MVHIHPEKLKFSHNYLQDMLYIYTLVKKRTFKGMLMQI